MGEENSSKHCSWQKMVIAKSNNEWSSTIKAEQREYNFVGSSDNGMLSDTSITYPEVKLEIGNRIDGQYLHQDGDSDPLGEDGATPQRRRRKGSIPKPESPEERAVRLAKMSAYAAQRLANETPEQRSTRLRRMSEYAAKRLSQETKEQRAKRLARMSAYAAKRLSQETPEQRSARLARMSAYAARRQAMKRHISSNSVKNQS